MMAFNFKLPCAVTCFIISFRGVRQGKNNNDKRRNYPKGQINNFVVSLLFLVGNTYMSIIKPINRLVRAKAYSWLLLSSWKNSTYSLLYQLKALKTFQLLVESVASWWIGEC